MNYEKEWPPDLTCRTWYIYERQSRPEQVKKHKGSTAHQRRLRDVLMDHSAAEVNVVELGGDLGRTSQGIKRRSDYRFLLEQVRSGKPIGVAARSIHRLGRRGKDVLTFLEECEIQRVPMFIGDRLCDTEDQYELMVMELNAVLGSRGNAQHHDWMKNCRIEKAREGIIVGSLPIGVIKLKDGRPARDPNPEVQAAVYRVFREFRRWGTIRATAIALKREEVKLPVKDGEGLDWRYADIWIVERFIKNPLYAGTYIFRKNVVDRRLGQDDQDHWKIRKALPEEQVVMPALFEGYITWEEFLENQARLRRNAGSAKKGDPTASAALLKKLFRCLIHPDRVMTPRGLNHRRNGSRGLGYQCHGEGLNGGPYCHTVNAVYADKLVKEAIRNRITAPRYNTIKMAYDQARGDEQAERFRLERELLRTRQLEERRAHLFETEEDVVVRAELRKKWREAIQQRESLEAQLASTADTKSVFDDQGRFEEFLELCTNAGRLIDLATPGEVKDIANILIETVWLEEYSPRRLAIRILWKDGGSETPMERKLWGSGYQLILEWKANGIPAPEMADRLNAEEILTMKQCRWSQRLVSAAVERLGATTPRPRKSRDESAQEGPIVP